MIKKKDGRGRLAEQLGVVVEDFDGVDAGGLSGLDLAGAGNELSAPSRRKIVDVCGEGDRIASGGEAGAAGSRIGQREEGSTVHEAVNVQNLFVDDHFHAGVAVFEVDDAHVVGLQILAGRVQPFKQFFIFYIHTRIIVPKVLETLTFGCVIMPYSHSGGIQMSSNQLLQYIVAVILMAYCIYQLYTSIKLFRKDRTGTAEYLKAHPGAERKSYSLAFVWFILACGILALVLACFGSFVTPEGQNTIIYQITYFCIGLIFLGLAADAFIHRHLIFSEDGYYLGGEAYRYRAILSMEQKKSFFSKNIRINFANGNSMETTRKMGEAIKDNWLAWKAAKKERKARKHAR